VFVTPFGRYEFQRLSSSEVAGAPQRTIDRLPVPVGSPFGSTDQDWEYVELERAKVGELKVRLGYQFESVHYDASLLQSSINGHIGAGTALIKCVERGAQRRARARVRRRLGVGVPLRLVSAGGWAGRKRFCRRGSPSVVERGSGASLHRRVASTL
jgi:hypothetical protein